jgi:hypothetical protein
MCAMIPPDVLLPASGTFLRAVGQSGVPRSSPALTRAQWARRQSAYRSLILPTPDALACAVFQILTGPAG